jgi:ribosomal protein S18 acetylase RimI-like enzyme
LKTNRAQRLYERLGFRKVDEDGMYFEMLASPGSCETHE